jgi:predicted Zn-dependent protease with MMP-like domain
MHGEGKQIAQNAIDTVPKEHVDRLNRITFQNKELGTSGNALGLYTNSEHRIQLRSNFDYSNKQKSDNEGLAGGMRSVALHEIGHYVHLGKLSIKAANEWNGLSQNGQTARISSYARTNTTEHFAEAYRAYAEGGFQREKLATYEPKSYQFMTRLFTAPASMLKAPGSRAGASQYWKRTA